jgi:hypothetical protein
MTVLRYTIFALTLGVLAGGLHAVPAQAQDAPQADAQQTGAGLDAVEAQPSENVKAPPAPTGPTYNPPPPSGKDWGKLPQATREQILNDWKALSEADREPFIFYRERAMAKLPDSAYSENPYKPETPEAAAARAAGHVAPAAAPVADEKSGGLLNKLFNKDKENAAQ